MRPGFTLAAATQPIPECTVKKALCELVKAFRNAQESKRMKFVVNLDALEPLVDPDCAAASLTKVIEKHDAYRAGKEVGELDPITKFLFDSIPGKAMFETIKVDSTSSACEELLMF